MAASAPTLELVWFANAVLIRQWAMWLSMTQPGIWALCQRPYLLLWISVSCHSADATRLVPALYRSCAGVAVDERDRPLVLGYTTSSSLVAGALNFTITSPGTRWWLTAPTYPLVSRLNASHGQCHLCPAFIFLMPICSCGELLTPSRIMMT